MRRREELEALIRRAEQAGMPGEAAKYREELAQVGGASAAALAAQRRQAGLARLERDFHAGPRWPWRSVDALTGPLLPGSLDIVGGRPSAGKTTLLLNAADHFAHCEIPWLYLGQERGPEELATLWAALRLGLNAAAVLCNDWHDLPAGAKDAIRSDLLRQTAPPLVDLAHFSDARRLSAISLRKWIVEFGVPRGCQVILVDHIHRLQHGLDATQLRYETSEAVRMLKEVAVKHNLVLLVAAQLNRGERDLLELHYPPPLSALKETGALEEEADLVVMLSRTLKRDATAQELQEVRRGQRKVEHVEEPNVMSLRVAKHRLRGVTGTASLVVEACGRLTGWERQRREPGEDDGPPF